MTAPPERAPQRPTVPGAAAPRPTPPGSTSPELPSRHAVALVARRELSQRVHDRSFLVSTGVTLLILLALVIVPRLAGGSSGTRTVAVADPVATAVVAAAADEAKQLGAPAIRARRYPSAAAADAAVRTGAVSAAVVGTERVVVKDTLDPQLGSLLSSAAHQRALFDRLVHLGVSPTQAAATLRVPLDIEVLQPQSAKQKDAQGIAFVAVLLLYGQFLAYGFWVAIGVVEEKASRVVEVLLSTVRPRELLVGKVVGTGLLGLLQLLVVGVVGLGAALAVGAVHLSGTAVTTLGQVLLWFVLGFVLFAFVFGAAAATVSRQEDLQSVTGPLTLALVAVLFAGIHAAQSPAASSSTVLSFVPPFSAVAMPPRWAAGVVPLWQVGVSAALMVLTAAVVAEVGARVYERTVLRIGARVPWRQALRRTAP